MCDKNKEVMGVVSSTQHQIEECKQSDTVYDSIFSKESSLFNLKMKQALDINMDQGAAQQTINNDNSL